MEELIQAHCLEKERTELFTQLSLTYPARAESARAVTGRRQGSQLFSKFEFSIKPDLRDLSLSYGGLVQFFIKCR